MSQSRKQRGRESEAHVAEWFRTHGWPYAERTGAGRPGVDITGMPGLAPEVKARTGFDPTGWLAQACARPGLPFVVVRPNGYGPARIADWPVLMRLSDATVLLRAAGYGDPTTPPKDTP